MTMSDSSERRRKPEGGYYLISVGAILRCWEAYRSGQIEFRDLRVWFGAHEVLARRCMVGKGRKASFKVDELKGLVGGVGGEHFRSSLRVLEALGLISWRESAVSFPKLKCGQKGERRLVPVPRRTLRFLAASSRPVLVATVLGHLIRCVFIRNGECLPRGTCKASWIAQVFGVNVRGVKEARKELARIGWLEKVGSDHWHRQRWGASVVVNLGWASEVRGEMTDTKLPPREELSTSEKPPPESNKKLLTESRYQKLRHEPSGVKKQEGEKPTIKNIRLQDLLHFSRCEELYRQAVAARWVKPSESQALAWIGAAVRAKSVAGDPVRIFAGIVRKKLWRNITNDQEDRARKALNRYRETNDAWFRVEEEGQRV